MHEDWADAGFSQSLGNTSTTVVATKAIPSLSHSCSNGTRRDPWILTKARTKPYPVASILGDRWGDRSR
uniref:Uncharacterized protein n=1 Tax=Tolypothrix bouteillei VB521301 TaxID=1479485 RepID=A0A0C1NB97_9CYAN